MGVLHLENVPDDLLRQLDELAADERRAVDVQLMYALGDILGRKRTSPSSRQWVAELLDAIKRHPLRPDPDGPDVVAMLREDRDR